MVKVSIRCNQCGARYFRRCCYPKVVFSHASAIGKIVNLHIRVQKFGCSGAHVHDKQGLLYEGVQLCCFLFAPAISSSQNANFADSHHRNNELGIIRC